MVALQSRGTNGSFETRQSRRIGGCTVVMRRSGEVIPFLYVQPWKCVPCQAVDLDRDSANTYSSTIYRPFSFSLVCQVSRVYRTGRLVPLICPAVFAKSTRVICLS